MHRPTVGVFALVLLVIGATALLVVDDSYTRQNVAGACLRIGAVLAALWLALPELQRSLNRWTLLAPPQHSYCWPTGRS